MVPPVDNNEKMKYYLMRCTSQKMRLLEYFDDNGFIYERGSIVLKGYFFQETHQTNTHVQDYQLDVTSCQYSHLVCAAHIKLIKVQSKRKKKLENGKCSKSIMNE
jgi:hypothetical protein